MPENNVNNLDQYKEEKVEVYKTHIRGLMKEYCAKEDSILIVNRGHVEYKFKNQTVYGEMEKEGLCAIGHPWYDNSTVSVTATEKGANLIGLTLNQVGDYLKIG